MFPFFAGFGFRSEKKPHGCPSKAGEERDDPPLQCQVPPPSMQLPPGAGLSPRWFWNQMGFMSRGGLSMRMCGLLDLRRCGMQCLELHTARGGGGRTAQGEVDRHMARTPPSQNKLGSVGASSSASPRPTTVVPVHFHQRHNTQGLLSQGSPRHNIKRRITPRGIQDAHTPHQMCPMHRTPEGCGGGTARHFSHNRGKRNVTPPPWLACTGG